MAVRKHYLLWLMAILLSAMLIPAAMADSVTFGMVTSNTVNMRQQPSLDSPLVTRYERGVWIAIDATVGDWYHATGPDGKAGYISSQFIDAGDDPIGTVGIVNNPQGTQFLNLRLSPDYSAKVLGIYHTGVPCVLLGLNNGWYHVRVNGTDGYFRSEYITPQTMAWSGKVATVATPNHKAVNMRSGPDTTYPILKQLKDGEYVMVLKQGKDWWRVSGQGYVGYINATFLKEGVFGPDGANALINTAPSATSAPYYTAPPYYTNQPYPTAMPYATPVPTPRPTAAPMVPTSSGYAVVTNPKESQVLNMRRLPDGTAEVIGRYANGAQLTVVKQGEEWCMVRNANGEVGYMMTDYLTLRNLPEHPTARVNHPQHTYVYLRSLASKNSGTMMARVPHGAQVTVMIPGDTWTKVRYNGQTGYMMTSFLQQ